MKLWKTQRNVITADNFIMKVTYNVHNIKMLIQLGIFIPIIWVATRNILFSRKRDEREILALFKSLKTTVISAVFVIGLIIILNLLNGTTSIPIMYIFIIALVCCVYLGVAPHSHQAKSY
ncbi:hypothetical protein [Clostridium pasteurianum]|uniref:Uncharacterized protein n=1 Tax=Clostridium pasteurianum BC1 TaxID=86416 RepID=R4K8V9_CLOPA|nr:hypothetical protein [Clostridium pasteurianum]AGK99607.1 hypothetical protein Clopa_4938 [Clostridium pasteurianum BC1]